MRAAVSSIITPNYNGQTGVLVFSDRTTDATGSASLCTNTSVQRERFEFYAPFTVPNGGRSEDEIQTLVVQFERERRERR